MDLENTITEAEVSVDDVSTKEIAEVFTFLCQLRVSEDAPNMMYGSAYIQNEFGFDKYTSKRLASAWRKWFGLQEKLSEITSNSSTYYSLPLCNHNVLLMR